ncbi:MAG: sigma-54 dependent transcriptional regulator [Verrucomicrobia bacterium]|nr:sigma-54 dependent transcriptional regulator [Verrucomicrobiota bacterium]MDA1087095.1 sigma-54 dependent transcriptional regulator [Verrucomicrobiota bacterium]
MAKRILVVDDENLIRWSLKERLTKDGHEVVEAATGGAARRAAEQGPLDLVLLDLRLPDADGVVVMKNIHRVQPNVPVLIITAYSTVATAVEAIKEGAYDYIAKPFNMDELAIIVRRALETSTLQRNLSLRIDEDKERFGLSNLVGESKVMQDIGAMIRKVARSATTTILLRGESGTGKDLVARVIHYESERANRMFMDISCTAITDTLLESELFGHEKGAFTDAKRQKKGYFELADGGTVFLDEIGDMSALLQSKLLHVLEYKSFKRVGGGDDISVDVRIVAATNRDLEDAVQESQFREDLYYRFNVLPIIIPPLRDRIDDVPLLANHFLRDMSAELRRGEMHFSREAMHKLEDYRWPGNVRELRNAVERALLLCEADVITGDDILLGRSMVGNAAQKTDARIILPAEGCELEQVERELVAQALARTQGNRTRAAQLLGVSRDQVRYKIEKYGLDA